MRVWERVIAVIVAIEAVAVGCIFLLGSPKSVSGPAYEKAKELTSMHAWGVLFLIVGICVFLAIAISTRGDNLPLVLTASAAIHAFFGMLFLLAAANNGGSGMVGGAEWLAFAGVVFAIGQVEIRTP